MKKLKSILLAGLLTTGLFTTTVFTSCDQDACKDVVCQNDGTCTDGSCTCPVGFEGTTCETESRTKLIGSFLLSGTDSDGDTYTNINANASVSSVSKTKFILAFPAAGWSFTCTMTASNAFSIDNVTVSGTTFSGNGTFIGNALSVTINENDATGTLVYNLTGNKQ